jgi:non-specific serine/threonine protein kinase
VKALGLLAIAWLVVSCGGGTVAATTPKPPPPSVTFSPLATPAPQPVQKLEPSLPAPIEEAAAAVASGQLYVMGGFDAPGNSLESTYAFDGSTWRSGPRLLLPLDHPSAATLDGQLYIAGGHSNGRDSVRVFRLDSDHWTELASMNFARGGHSLVAAEGRLFAIGGNTVRGNVPAIESFDPSANAWTVLPSLPDPRNHVMGFVLGGAACVAGGRSPTTPRVDCFDVASGSWTRLPDLPRASSGGGALTFVGGDVIVMGGQDASETRIIDQLARYRADSGWTASEAMLAPRHGFELAMFQGRAWACGGGSAPGLHPVATCTSVGDPSAAQRGK